MKASRFVLMSLPLVMAAGCGGYDSPTGSNLPRPSRVVTGSGDVTATVAEFRTLLGDPNNGGTTGAQAAGHSDDPGACAAYLSRRFGSVRRAPGALAQVLAISRMNSRCCRRISTSQNTRAAPAAWLAALSHRLIHGFFISPSPPVESLPSLTERMPDRPLDFRRVVGLPADDLPRACDA